MLKFTVLSLFPDTIKSLCDYSILAKAIQRNLVSINNINIRDYSLNKHNKVDDTPYGGGGGMLMTCQPLFDAIEDQKKFNENAKVIYFSPRGKRMNQELVESTYNNCKDFILICGHYEGIDQRVIDSLVDEEVSIGDYVISGGELASCVFIDAISRMHEGVLGNEASAKEESFSLSIDRKKEYPHYTRPQKFRNIKVPDVLINGNHKEIEKWRKNNAS